MAFVLVQHLDPKHESKLTDLLSKTTRMPIREASDGMALSADEIYVIPPNASMTVEQGRLRLTPRGEGRGQHLTVDHFFKSLAQESGSGAIGVVLSGTGSDGTQGLEEIKAAGGITFAQGGGHGCFHAGNGRRSGHGAPQTHVPARQGIGANGP